MRVYTEYKVLEFTEHDGLATVEWSVKGKPAQRIILRHHVPPQAESENWTEEQLVDHWRRTVPDVPRCPPWIVEALKA